MIARKLGKARRVLSPAVVYTPSGFHIAFWSARDGGKKKKIKRKG